MVIYINPSPYCIHVFIFATWPAKMNLYMRGICKDLDTENYAEIRRVVILDFWQLSQSSNSPSSFPLFLSPSLPSLSPPYPLPCNQVHFAA